MSEQLEHAITFSENRGELFAAMAKMQGALGPAIKGKVNPHFKSSYADLAGHWNAARDPLSENGLCIIQTTQEHPRGACVLTTLGHSSGEWMLSTTVVPVDKGNAQGFGSALTYARRYGFSAITGTAPDDDDGNRAASAPRRQQKRKPVTFFDHASCGAWAQGAKGVSCGCGVFLFEGEAPKSQDEAEEAARRLDSDGIKPGGQQ